MVYASRQDADQPVGTDLSASWLEAYIIIIYSKYSYYIYIGQLSVYSQGNNDS